MDECVSRWTPWFRAPSILAEGVTVSDVYPVVELIRAAAGMGEQMLELGNRVIWV